MKELDYGKMGMRIRQVRKAKGWSQEMLAKKCGISMSFLGHIERGTRIMSLETFVSLCGALEAGADELLWGTVLPSEAVLDMWGAGKPAGKAPAGKQADSYSMYVKIMKSVAEIMNEA
ncbi:MAG: helix-turn-helix transcriptional regulator [Eubacterium sp.]|nr:helix-turn-helix transcriptional regulator [Eubacterium sp.]